jgi:hypothetical protein
VLLDYVEHQACIPPPLTLEMACVAYFKDATAPSNFEALTWELFEPVLNRFTETKVSELKRNRKVNQTNKWFNGSRHRLQFFVMLTTCSV